MNLKRDYTRYLTIDEFKKGCALSAKYGVDPRYVWVAMQDLKADGMVDQIDAVFKKVAEGRPHGGPIHLKVWSAIRDLVQFKRRLDKSIKPNEGGVWADRLRTRTGI